MNKHIRFNILSNRNKLIAIVCILIFSVLIAVIVRQAQNQAKRDRAVAQQLKTQEEKLRSLEHKENAENAKVAPSPTNPSVKPDTTPTTAPIAKPVSTTPSLAEQCLKFENELYSGYFYNSNELRKTYSIDLQGIYNMSNMTEEQRNEAIAKLKKIINDGIQTQFNNYISSVKRIGCTPSHPETPVYY